MTTATLYYGEGLYGAGEYVDAVSQGRETKAVNDGLRAVPTPFITGMKLKADVMLGDLVLNTIDANNVVWVCTDIEGWWGHPDPDIPDVTRGWRDGSYDARGRWQARQLTLSGVFLTPDSDYVSAARNTLIEATALVYEGAWLKTLESPTRASYVRLSGRPEITTTNARGRTEFSIGLRAADPVKYSWNDADPEGYDNVTIPCKSTSGATGEVVIDNVGNTTVSTFLAITGPVVGPATVYNVQTDDLMTIVDTLRGSSTKTVSNKALTSNIATLTTSTTHELVAGDTVTVSGVDSTFNGEYEVIATPTTSTFTYSKTASNVGSTAASGSAVRAADVLEIDTYEREVALNGLVAGARVILDTLTDWVTLGAGNNTIRFVDEGAAASTASLTVSYRSGWIG
jgi:hypothetical protein